MPKHIHLGSGASSSEGPSFSRIARSITLAGALQMASQSGFGIQRQEVPLMLIQSTSNRVSADSRASVWLVLSPLDGRREESIYGAWRERRV